MDAVETSIQILSRDLHELTHFVREQYSNFIRDIKEDRILASQSLKAEREAVAESLKHERAESMQKNETLANRFEKLTENVYASQRPDWHLYVGAGTLLFIIICALGGPIYLNDSFNAENTRENRDELKELRLEIKELYKEVHSARAINTPSK